MRLVLLHTNDLHGRLDRGRLPFLLEQRKRADLYFDTGDCIKTGNLGVPLRPEPVWGLLEEAACDVSVIGNRETHVLESAFKAKLAGAAHPVLCANLRKRDGSRPLPGSVILGRDEYKIGVVGVSVAMVTERMRTQAASFYLWDSPIESAKQLCQQLRPRVDSLFVLSHIGHAQDLRLAEACPEADIVFGGHSHTVLETPVQVGKTWVVQGGSHARFLGRYEWDGRRLKGGLLPWPGA